MANSWECGTNTKATPKPRTVLLNCTERDCNKAHTSIYMRNKAQCTLHKSTLHTTNNQIKQILTNQHATTPSCSKPRITTIMIVKINKMKLHQQEGKAKRLSQGYVTHKCKTAKCKLDVVVVPTTYRYLLLFSLEEYQSLLKQAGCWPKILSTASRYRIDARLQSRRTVVLLERSKNYHIEMQRIVITCYTLFVATYMR